MKKFLSVLFPIVLIIAFLFAGPVFANEQKVAILPSSQTINHDYFSAASDVQIHGTVNGDLYAAGGNVLIDGTINGDIIAVGGNVVISGKARDVRVAGGTVNMTNATIEGNITTAGGQISIAEPSRISGSLVATGGSINLSADLGKGANIAGGNINLDSSIKGDVNAATGNLTITPNSTISGNLTYWSRDKANIAEGATISGTIKHEIPPEPEKEPLKPFATGASIAFRIFDLITSLVIGLLLIYLMPLFSSHVIKNIANSPLKGLIIGFLSFILFPILMLVLLITVLGIPFALILLFAFILIVYVGKIYISYAIGSRLLQAFGQQVRRGWILLIGLILYALIALIPVLGGIFQFFAVMLGVGILLLSELEYIKLLRTKKLL